MSAVASTPSRTNESTNFSPATQSLEHSADGTDNVSGAKVTKQAKPPNIMSKYLVQYVPKLPEKKKASQTRVTDLRVLTSAEGIAILKDKEDKKQKEKEEKEKRKQERVKKRKEKEELAKRRAEQKKSATSKKTST